MRLTFIMGVLLVTIWQVAQCQTVMRPRPVQHGFRKLDASNSSERKTPEIPPGAPVVILRGVCVSQQSESCESLITRADLDEYASTIARKTASRAHSATQYAATLALSTLAKQCGLDKDLHLTPKTGDEQHFGDMRALALAFLENLQGRTAPVEESEIQKYYDEHQNDYRRIQVRRIWVPTLAPTEDGRPLKREAIRAEMETVRAKAIAGANLDELQKNAFISLGIQATPPPVTLTSLREVDLQGSESEISKLKSGDISEVLDLPAAFAVVKLESHDTMQIESVRGDIRAVLFQDHLQEELRSATKNISAKFNLAYLHLSAPPDLFGWQTLPLNTRDLKVSSTKTPLSVGQMLMAR